MLAARLRASRKLASGALRASNRNPSACQLRVSNVKSSECTQGCCGERRPTRVPGTLRDFCHEASLPAVTPPSTPTSPQTLLEPFRHKNLRELIILGK